MTRSKRNVIIILFCAMACFWLLVGFSEEHASQISGVKKPVTITTIPVQLGRDAYGLAMVDVETQTLWVYQFDTRSQTFENLRLIAARSFEYDRKLTEWNTGTPTPTQVQKILETLSNQRRQKQESKIEAIQDVLEQE